MAEAQIKSWVVDYRDVADHDNRHTTRLRGYSREHVEMRFYDAPDADGWEIVSIKPARRP